MFKRISTAVLLFSLLAVPAAYAQKAKKGKQPAPNFGNVEGVTAKQLKDYLTFIASDELEGRDTPSRGLDIAAIYLAQHLASWGLKPAGDNGTYFQKVPLKREKIDIENTRFDVNGKPYVFDKDFRTTLTPTQIAGANFVFAGHGYVVNSKNLNPYQGIDVKDKIIIVISGLPKGVTNNDLQGPPGQNWQSPALYGQNNGAKAILNFPSFNALANWREGIYITAEKGDVSFGNQPPFIKIPTITASPAMLAALFYGEKFSASNLFNRAMGGEAVESFALDPAKKANINIDVKTEQIATQNVAGILEGSDPVLKNEYVAIGAHYDHVGMNPYAPGDDKIWNGADDDGSGTVSVLNIAEAFAKGAVKPKRSILFIWHAGEEKGLWGSEHYVNNPTVPIASIITQLNVDMIGRYQNPGDEDHAQNKNLPKPNEVFTIGAGMMSTELGKLSDEVNKSFLNLNFNTKYDGPDHPEQFFYRSDHFNYAKKGIPIIFYMDGSHADYHRPSDSIEKINFEQMEKVARTIMATGWTLANRPTRPVVDKPLPASVTKN